MKSRIKQVRKAAGLNQEEFGRRIGAKQNTIAAYECGARTPTDIAVSSICRVFNVSEDWLRTGEGPMYVPATADEELAKFFAEVMNDQPESIRKRWAVAFSKLSMAQWEALADIAETLAGK